MTLKKLGKYMQAIRLAADASQQDIADLCAFSSAQFISNIERGLTIPSPVAIKAYSVVTGTHHDDIISHVISHQRSEMWKAVDAAKIYKKRGS